MSDQSLTQDNTKSEASAGATPKNSALGIEAVRVKKMMNTDSKQRSDDDESALVKAERAVLNQQESRVRQTAGEVKDTGAGTNEPARDLNKDG
jgi:hypothetical protein